MTIYKIGRGEGNHVVLTDKSVSRQHAELEELGAGRFRLKDLGSSSGTHMLNGAEWTEVKETEVRHDTRIRFGEYETTPMDLVRDQDKTVVQARATPAAEAPRPAAPQPATPKPAAPKPAAPKPAAPRPTPPRPAAPAAAPSPPRPAAPRPAPAARPAGAGTGMDKKTMWFVIGGGGALLLLALIAVVVVLATGGEQRSTEVRDPPARTETPRTEPPPRTETPPPRTETPPPRTEPPRQPPPATQGGLQRMTQACRTSWQGSEAVCSCVARAVQPVLQEADYDDAIEVMTMVFTNKGDDARQKVQQMVQAGGQEKAQRIVSAVQAIGRDCKSVQ